MSKKVRALPRRPDALVGKTYRRKVKEMVQAGSCTYSYCGTRTNILVVVKDASRVHYIPRCQRHLNPHDQLLVIDPMADPIMVEVEAVYG